MYRKRDCVTPGVGTDDGMALANVNFFTLSFLCNVQEAISRDFLNADRSCLFCL